MQFKNDLEDSISALLEIQKNVHFIRVVSIWIYYAVQKILWQFNNVV